MAGNRMPDINTLVVIADPKRARALIGWAAYSTRTSGGRLHVLSFKGPSGGSPKDNVAEVITDAVAEITDIPIDTHVLDHPNPSIAVVEQVEALGINFLILGYDGTRSATLPEHRLPDRLLRFAPCEVLVLDPGESDGTRCENTLVPIHGSFALSTLKQAKDYAGKNGRVFALHVGSQFGSDSEEVAHKELEFEIREAGITIDEKIEPTIAIAARPIDGILEKCREHDCDLVLLSATTPRVINKLRNAPGTESIPPLAARVAIGVARPAKPKRNWLERLVSETVFGWLPRLQPAHRVELFDRLQAGARWNADFIVMMGLSTVLAALGLLQNSTAVVIGAMLVAPLMTPLIGAGLALVQGNLRLFTGSIRAMGLGVLTGFSLSLLTGLATPNFPFTEELIARGAPNILDLGIALISGMAAAYAIARPNVLAAMAGVAIAAALVPPLATVGVALADGKILIAEGAATLLLTNLVTIILGAALVFVMLGVRGGSVGLGPKLWVRRTVIALVVLSGLLVLPLGYRLADQIKEGQNMPLAYPIATKLENAIMRRVAREPGIDLILAGRGSEIYGELETDIDVGLLLSSERPVSAAFKQELRDMVRDFRKKDVGVAVWVLLDAPEVPDTTSEVDQK